MPLAVVPQGMCWLKSCWFWLPTEPVHQRLKFCNSMWQIGINTFIDDMILIFFFFFLNDEGIQARCLHLWLTILVLLVSSRTQLILATANTSMFGCRGKWKICLWKSTSTYCICHNECDVLFHSSEPGRIHDWENIGWLHIPLNIKTFPYEAIREYLRKEKVRAKSYGSESLNLFEYCHSLRQSTTRK